MDKVIEQFREKFWMNLDIGNSRIIFSDRTALIDDVETFILKALKEREKALEKEFKEILLRKQRHYNLREKMVLKYQREDILKEERKKTLKELITEFNNNELEGKGYDFYLSIRSKIDELNN